VAVTIPSLPHLVGQMRKHVCWARLGAMEFSDVAPGVSLRI
jgi:hypothetical protein